MNAKSELSLVLFLIVLTIGSFFVVHDQFAPVPAMPERVAEIFAQQPEVFVLGSRTQTEGCQVNGPLPDPECTPGSVFPDAGLEKICVSGYSKTVRSVSTSLKKKVYAAYGIPYPPPRGSYEADHLIPLAIGGNNDIANLFPESGNTTPGFREKDIVENYLRGEVCDGRVSLKSAQMQIAENWLAVYDKLTPSDISRIKNMFKNSYGSP